MEEMRESAESKTAGEPRNMIVGHLDSSSALNFELAPENDMMRRSKCKKSRRSKFLPN